ncbi:hypothetical protein [Azospirillum argentinense]|uniref:hypothetical protein n=1 Tax=Azospirillum argentinense TaxID=2970906 RepID=UPI0032DF4113
MEPTTTTTETTFVPGIDHPYRGEWRQGYVDGRAGAWSEDLWRRDGGSGNAYTEGWTRGAAERRSRTANTGLQAN